MKQKRIKKKMAYLLPTVNPTANGMTNTTRTITTTTTPRKMRCFSLLFANGSFALIRAHLDFGINTAAGAFSA
jgi:hypothetical protein